MSEPIGMVADGHTPGSSSYYSPLEATALVCSSPFLPTHCYTYPFRTFHFNIYIPIVHLAVPLSEALCASQRFLPRSSAFAVELWIDRNSLLCTVRAEDSLGATFKNFTFRRTGQLCLLSSTGRVKPPCQCTRN